MKMISTADGMSRWALEARKDGKKIALVPTMGGLHEGHLALVREAKKQADLTVVSLFVNPAQFNDASDYERYPREIESDLKKCGAAGVDVVFAPEKDDIYPPGETPEAISLPAVAKVLEGPLRPGHFEGVVQVVARLFRIVRPHVAVFGMKDYQQVRVIEEMVIERGSDVKIVRVPTVRSREGLALSSRNGRLSREGLKKALLISKTLKAAQHLVSQGERHTKEVLAKLRKGLSCEEDIRIDYLKIVDARTLEEVAVISEPALIAVAALVEGVRLIDNCVLSVI